jgi:integrase
VIVKPLCYGHLRRSPGVPGSPAASSGSPLGQFRNPEKPRNTASEARDAAVASKAEKRRKPAQITFHLLRRTRASLLLVEGVRPKIAQEMLGHVPFLLRPSPRSYLASRLSSVVPDRGRSGKPVPP